MKILLIGMASGRWHGAINEWYAMATETRIGLSHAKEDKELWRLRLRKLEDLVIYGLIEVKVSLYENGINARIMILQRDI